jgi:hypothetical protein
MHEQIYSLVKIKTNKICLKQLVTNTLHIYFIVNFMSSCVTTVIHYITYITIRSISVITI